MLPLALPQDPPSPGRSKTIPANRLPDLTPPPPIPTRHDSPPAAIETGVPELPRQQSPVLPPIAPASPARPGAGSNAPQESGPDLQIPSAMPPSVSGRAMGGPLLQSDGQSPPPASEAPQVVVELIAPESANVGQAATYEIVVRNLGKSAVYQVRVEQEIPAGLRYLGGEPRAEYPNDRLVWNLGILDPGAEKRISANLQSNAEGELKTKATVSYATTCGSVTRFTRPKLSVSITGPESVMIGDTAVFQIRLANSGSGPIHKLVLRDRLPAGLQHPQGNLLEAEVAGLAPGESRLVTLKTTATKVGVFVHEIHAIADGYAAENVQLAGGIARNSDLEASAKTEIHVLEPGLQVKVTGPKSCLVRCEGILSVDLTNPGSATTKNIHLGLRLPEGTDYVGVSDDGTYDAATRTANWEFPTLEPSAHRVLTVKIRGAQLGDAAGVCIAQADGGLNSKAELPIRIEGVPALALEVVAADDPAPVGADAHYEIRVVNRGTCPCTGIQIAAIMPEGMELREVSAPSPYKLTGQQIQFAAFSKLATRADIVYRLKVRSKVDGDVRFRVQLTCDQLQQPVLKEESSRFYKP
jgi:uncharacterized repeat protein (TIGR01451 family)